MMNADSRKIRRHQAQRHGVGGTVGTLLVAAAFVVVAAGAGRGADREYVMTETGAKAEAIVAVDNVCAWPNLTVLPDGAIAAVIHNQPSHGTQAGDADCYASTDGGRTWAKRGTPAPHEPETNRMNLAAGVAGNGDLIVACAGWSNQYEEGKSGIPFRAHALEPWLSRSADGGRTWVVDKASFPGRLPTGDLCTPFGDILPGADGKLRVAAYGAAGRVFIYHSEDDGKTWGEPVALDDDGDAYEPALLHLGDGKWLAVTRWDGLTLYASDDDAKTWTRQMPVTGAAQHPGHLLRLADGRVLLSYGNRTPGDKGVDVRLSSDEGKTWGEPRRVVDFEGDGGYPSSVQRPDGQIVTAYYATKIEGHGRYHMGVVIWVPPAAE